MLNTLFNSIFDSSSTTTFALPQFLICLFVAIALGIGIATVYKAVNKSSQSFSLTLALLPAVVAIVIMIVNGNIGAGVAVAGAFSLVRFRSAPGSAKEISMIFLAMGCGLICGMGYIAYAILFAIVLCVALLILVKFNFCGKKCEDQILRITIPEDLNYVNVFDEVFEEFTTIHKLHNVKTTNMGSMFKLTYHVSLKDSEQQKAFLDALRVRNGNLEIALSNAEDPANEL